MYSVAETETQRFETARSCGPPADISPEGGIACLKQIDTDKAPINKGRSQYELPLRQAVRERPRMVARYPKCDDNFCPRGRTTSEVVVRRAFGL